MPAATALRTSVTVAAGVAEEAVAACIDELGVEGTSDEIPKPRLRTGVVLAPGVRLEVDDPGLAAQVRAWQLEGLAVEAIIERLQIQLGEPPPAAEAGTDT